jgi:hypothetical protein
VATGDKKEGRRGREGKSGRACRVLEERALLEQFDIKLGNLFLCHFKILKLSKYHFKI